MTDNLTDAEIEALATGLLNVAGGPPNSAAIILYAAIRGLLAERNEARGQVVSLREDVTTARDWCSAERFRVAEEIALAIEAAEPARESEERSALIQAAKIARSHKEVNP